MKEEKSRTTSGGSGMLADGEVAIVSKISLRR